MPRVYDDRWLSVADFPVPGIDLTEELCQQIFEACAAAYLRRYRLEWEWSDGALYPQFNGCFVLSAPDAASIVFGSRVAMEVGLIDMINLDRTWPRRSNHMTWWLSGR